MSTVDKMQKLIAAVPALAGYTVERRHTAYYLRNPADPQGAIYLPSMKTAEKWIAEYKRTGRDNAAMRRIN